MREYTHALAACLMAFACSDCTSMRAAKIPQHTRVKLADAGVNIWSYEKAIVSQTEIREDGAGLYSFLDTEVVGNCWIIFENGMTLEIKNGKVMHNKLAQIPSGRKVINYFVEKNEILPDAYIRTFR